MTDAVVALLREAFPSDERTWSGNFDDDDDKTLCEKLLAYTRDIEHDDCFFERVFGPTSALSKPAREYFSAWIRSSGLSNLNHLYVSYLESQPGPVYLDMSHWIWYDKHLPKNLGWTKYSAHILAKLALCLADKKLTSYDKDSLVSKAFAEELYARPGCANPVTLDLFARQYKGEYLLHLSYGTLFETWSVDQRTKMYDTLFHRLRHDVFRFFHGTYLFGCTRISIIPPADRIPCDYCTLRVDLFAYYRFIDDDHSFRLPLTMDAWKFLEGLRAVSAKMTPGTVLASWAKCIAPASLLAFLLDFGETILGDDSKRELGLALFGQLAWFLSGEVVRRLVASFRSSADSDALELAFANAGSTSHVSIWSLVNAQILEDHFPMLLRATRGDPFTWLEYRAVEDAMPVGKRRMVEHQACILELFDRLTDDSIEDDDFERAIDWELDQRNVSRKDLLRRIREPHPQEISQAREALRARATE